MKKKYFFNLFIFLVLLILVINSFSQYVTAVCVASDSDGGDVPETGGTCIVTVYNSQTGDCDPDAIYDDSCSGNSLTEYYDNGASCDSKTYDCTPYICSGDPGYCKTSCSSDSDCASGYICVNNACTCGHNAACTGCGSRTCGGDTYYCRENKWVLASDLPCDSSHLCDTTWCDGTSYSDANSKWKCVYTDHYWWDDQTDSNTPSESNNCNNGKDDDCDGYKDTCDTDCGRQCLSGDCCDTSTCQYQPSSYNPPGICKKCTGNSATPVNEDDNEDLFNECSVTWNSCDSNCVKRGGDGYCDGNGACDTNDATANVANGKVCVNGQEYSASDTHYCGHIDTCDTGDCYAYELYEGCYNGACSSNVNYGYKIDYYASSGKVLKYDCSSVAVSSSYYCAVADTCDNGDCSAYKYYRSCDGSGSCHTDNTDSYSVQITASNSKVLDANCNNVDATSTTYSCDHSYDYWASANACTYSKRYAECYNGACDYDASNYYYSAGTYYVPSGKVAKSQSGGTSVPTVAVSSSYYCDIFNDCKDGNCIGYKFYRSCDGSGSCHTDNTDSYNITIYADSGYSLTDTCGTTGTSYCGNSAYNGCTGAGAPYSCQKKADYYYCDGSGNCNQDSGSDLIVNVSNGKVCVNGNEYSGSTTYYAFSDNPDRCSSSNPDVGFGDAVYDVFACNGNNGQGPDVGDKTIDCGTGCCYDEGSNAYCVNSGNESIDFYDFGVGDNTVDYCFNAKVVDCNTNNACDNGFSCSYNNCLNNNGKMIFKDNSGNTIVIIDSNGKVLLKGSLYESTTATPSAGSFKIEKSGNTYAWIDNLGNLYLKGVLYKGQSSLSPSGGDDWIIKNSSNSIVLYIDGSTGDLYTLSNVNQNAIS